MNDTALEHYRFMARYNAWFNEQLYNACEQLSEAERKRDRGAFFSSIQHTLAHIVSADKVWLQRFAKQGTSFQSLPDSLLQLPPGANYTSDAYPDWQELRAQRVALDTAIQAWLADMPPAFLTHTMRYTNSKGVAREHPMWKAMSHFFNHQTHHRGQATTLLFQAGVDVGVTDLVALL